MVSFIEHWTVIFSRKLMIQSVSFIFIGECHWTRLNMHHAHADFSCGFDDNFFISFKIWSLSLNGEFVFKIIVSHEKKFQCVLFPNFCIVQLVINLCFSFLQFMDTMQRKESKDQLLAAGETQYREENDDTSATNFSSPSSSSALTLSSAQSFVPISSLG